ALLLRPVKSSVAPAAMVIGLVLVVAPNAKRFPGRTAPELITTGPVKLGFELLRLTKPVPSISIVPLPLMELLNVMGLRLMIVPPPLGIAVVLIANRPLLVIDAFPRPTPVPGLVAASALQNCNVPEAPMAMLPPVMPPVEVTTTLPPLIV